jgi:hypothetical protein
MLLAGGVDGFWVVRESTFPLCLFPCSASLRLGITPFDFEAQRQLHLSLYRVSKDLKYGVSGNDTVALRL